MKASRFHEQRRHLAARRVELRLIGLPTPVTLGNTGLVHTGVIIQEHAVLQLHHNHARGASERTREDLTRKVLGALLVVVRAECAAYKTRERRRVMG